MTGKELKAAINASWEKAVRTGEADLPAGGLFLERGYIIYKRIESDCDELWEEREYYNSDKIFLTTDTGDTPQEISDVEDLYEIFDFMGYDLEEDED